jgi:hypothetical protein
MCGKLYKYVRLHACNFLIWTNLLRTLVDQRIPEDHKHARYITKLVTRI